MANTSINPPKMGNIPLPLAAVQQWIEADSEDTASSWHYVSGLLSGILIFRPDISEELMFLHSIATQRGLMAAKGSTSTLPRGGGASPTAILAEIREASSSLEIFAWSATSPDFGRSHQQEMQEAALLMLARLEKLHAELKQAIAGEVQP